MPTWLHRRVYRAWPDCPPHPSLEFPVSSGLSFVSDSADCAASGRAVSTVSGAATSGVPSSGRTVDGPLDADSSPPSNTFQFGFFNLQSMALAGSIPFFLAVCAKLNSTARHFMLRGALM